MAKESLSEQAYRLIRDMIVRLDLTPGAVVREDDLQERLEIGRTPIREALQRLARDQFLVVIPRRGMIVSNIDIAELSTLYETRAILEPYVARLACERGTADHWKQMSKVLDRAKKQASTAQDQIQFGKRPEIASLPTLSTFCMRRVIGCGICICQMLPTWVMRLTNMMRFLRRSNLAIPNWFTNSQRHMCEVLTHKFAMPCANVSNSPVLSFIEC